MAICLKLVVHFLDMYITRLWPFIWANQILPIYYSLVFYLLLLCILKKSFCQTIKFK